MLSLIKWWNGNGKNEASNMQQDHTAFKLLPLATTKQEIHQKEVVSSNVIPDNLVQP